MIRLPQSTQHHLPALLIMLYTAITVCILSSIFSHASAQNAETATNTQQSQNSSAAEILTFNNENQQRIYQDLIIELRCPKCQNQNIADSNADIAQDMRSKVYEMVLANKTKSEIKTFMQARFGEFVLYKPQFSGKNILLWLGPIFVLLTVIFFVIRIIRKNAAHLVEAADDEIKR